MTTNMPTPLANQIAGTSNRSRTPLIWCILAYSGISALIPLVNLTSPYPIPFPVAIRVFGWLSAAFTVCGAVALYKMRASALVIFALVLTSDLVAAWYAIGIDLSGLRPLLGSALGTNKPGVLSAAVSALSTTALALSLAPDFGIVLYLILLRKRGLLR